MLYIRTFLLLISGIAVIFISCSQETIVVPKPCDAEPTLSFSRAKLSLTTDVTVTDTINIDSHGYIFGDNITITQNGITLNARIGGHICKENIFTVDVIYNNATDNSRLRIDGQMLPNYIITGSISYCDNLNNVCNFIGIGSIDGYYGGNYQGGFHTPLFNGSFKLDLLNN